MAISTSTPPTAVEAGGCAPDRLETERLLLRPLELGDAEAIAPLIADPEVATRTARIPYPNTVADARAWVAAAVADGAATGAITYAVLRQGDGALVGAAGLAVEADRRRAELGYWIGRPFWGQGYAREAVGRLLRFGFEELGLAAVEAKVLPDNLPSIRVLESVGFAAAGDTSCAAPARGGKLPALAFRLDRDAWLARHGRNLVLVVAAALLDAEDRVLLTRRPPGKPMAGLWEFPGGKLMAGESPDVALVRELMEELAIETRTGCLAPFAVASHAYPEFHLVMPLFLCRRWRGTPTAREGQELAWVRPARLGDYPMPAADAPLAAQLQDFL